MDREHGLRFKPQPETETGQLGDRVAFCATWDKVDRCHTGLMLKIHVCEQHGHITVLLKIISLISYLHFTKNMGDFNEQIFHTQ